MRSHGEVSAAEKSLLALPKVMPPFVGKIGRLATEIGFANAVVETFQDAGINLEVEGDDLPVGQGVVIASDHRQRLEPLLVQAVMAKNGREGSYVLAMPTSFSGRIAQASGKHGKELILPVVPSKYSIDKRVRSLSPRSMYRQRRYPNVYGRSLSETNSINSASITGIADLASKGKAGTIFPTGLIREAGNDQWRQGLGRIVQELSPEAWPTTQMVAFRSDTFSASNVVAALLRHDIGVTSRPQKIGLRVAKLGTAYELFGSFSGARNETVQDISNTMRNLYRDRFRQHMEG